MILCLYIELGDLVAPENLFDAFKLMPPGLVKGVYDSTSFDCLIQELSTLEDIENTIEGK